MPRIRTWDRTTKQWVDQDMQVQGLLREINMLKRKVEDMTLTCVDKVCINECDVDPITLEPPRYTIRLRVNGKCRCYDVESIYAWAIVNNKPVCPSTKHRFTDYQIRRITQEYAKIQGPSVESEYSSDSDS